MRILVVTEESELAEALRAPLERDGATVDRVDETPAVFAAVTRLGAQVVLAIAAEGAPPLADVVRAVAAHGAARPPVIGVLRHAAAMEILYALWSGADDVVALPLDASTLARITQVAGEPLQRTLVDRFLAVQRRGQITGDWELEPGTPFHARARFEQGALVSAEFSGLKGRAALEEMLWFQESDWTFGRASAPPAGSAPAPATKLPSPGPDALRPEILTVDDDPHLRELLKRQLGAAGFEVRVAPDGISGFESAAEQPPDVLLTDLDMPRLDGWGMLRRLRASHRTRDIPAVVYSGLDDAREALRAAKAGAHDYVSKQWRSDRVVQRMVNLAMPLVALRQSLAEREEVELPPATAGTAWVIRQLGRLGLTGTLEAEDAFGHYLVRFRDGEPVDATASRGPRTFIDFGAVGALLSARPTRRSFKRGAIEGARRIDVPTEELLRKTARALDRIAEAVLGERLVDLKAFTVDDELYALFRRLAPPRQLPIAHALIEEHLVPAEIARENYIPRDEVDEAVRELVRRGVIQLPAEPAGGRE